jgi:hypothetical protein
VAFAVGLEPRLALRLDPSRLCSQLCGGREGHGTDGGRIAADQPDHFEIVDVLRDDTFTVLFQKNGICYSVITLSEDEAWLSDLLTTWRFTD